MYNTWIFQIKNENVLHERVFYVKWIQYKTGIFCSHYKQVDDGNILLFKVYRSIIKYKS